MAEPRRLMAAPWSPTGAGVLCLPSGRLVRGRALSETASPEPLPTFGVYLLGSVPPPMAWQSRWVRCRDFWVPGLDDARTAFVEAWERADTERVEVACGGGVGRTGLGLACVAILDGLAPGKAVAFVRQRYHPRAVETPWQRRFVARFRRR
ncbi:protein phosphatase [Pilimelia columellifera]|uniref:Protein-tyrosine phosphatase family protein n=1 Tax=Pilimelia columellifera subsp. columellifera TaxID=706583 RepID=A0ABN3N9D1_9ACTN